MHNFSLHLVIEIFESVMKYIVFKYIRRINQIVVDLTPRNKNARTSYI